MRRGLRYGLLAGTAAAALVLSLPYLIPATAYKAPIEEIVSRATGRSFTIRGPLRFTLIPAIGITAGDVALANMPHGRAPAMLTADDVRVTVAVAPLLGGRVEVSTIVLDRPVIALEVDAQGRANWTLAKARGTAGTGEKARLRITAHFSGLKVVDGKVTYFNARTGSARAFDDVDATITLAELDQPALVDGAFTHAGQRVGVRAKVGTPQLLLQDRATALDLSVTSNLLSAAFVGTVSADGRGAGHLQIAAPSARAAATWLGAHLPDSDGLNALALESTFHGDNKTAEFTDLRLALDGATITGNLKLDATGDRAAVRGALRADRLDINPYIERPAPHIALPGPHRSDGWSEKPVTLGLLKKLDADLTLDTGRLTVRKLTVDRAHIAVSLAGGLLKARLDPMTLYGGTGQATLEVDANGPAPTYHNTLRFEHVALGPFLTDTIGVHQIEGTGIIALDITSRGDSARAIMGGLGGSGSIDFRNGRLRGVDLGAVARTIQHLLGSGVRESSFTDYSELGASFTLAGGVLDNRDFHLMGPVLQAAGSGQVDIGNRTIDFRIEPKAVATIAHERLTIGVPFRITGPWRHLHYRADVESLVNGVIENLESGKAPFKGLFGPPRDAKAAAPDGKKKNKHKNLDEALKNMLGIH
jgi:AsmA protein